MGHQLLRLRRRLTNVALPFALLATVVAGSAGATTTNPTNPGTITVGLEKPGPVSFTGQFTGGLATGACPSQQVDVANVFTCADLFIKVTDTGPVTVAMFFKIENFFQVVVYDSNGVSPPQTATSCTPPDPATTDCSATQFEAIAGNTYNARISPLFFGEFGCTDPMTGVPVLCPTKQQPARFNGTVTFNAVAANAASTTPGHRATGGGQTADLAFAMNPKQDDENPAEHDGRVRYRPQPNSPHSCTVRGDVVSAQWFDGERRVRMTLNHVFVNNKPIAGTFEAEGQDNGQGKNQITPDKFRILVPADSCFATGGDVTKGNIDYKPARPDFD
jgi:hypothetical protein